MPVSAPPANILTDMIGPTGRVTRRCEIFEEDGKTPFLDASNRLIDGSVSSTYSDDVRRTLDLSLYNGDDVLQIDYRNGLWYDKVIKLFRGITTASGVSWECQIGEFMIDRISRSSFPSTIKITGRDYVKKCLNSKFDVTTTFAAGEPVEQLIGNIASNAGIVKKVLPATGKVTTRDHTFDGDSGRWNAMHTIADAYGYELFFDATGYLTLRSYQDPVTAPTIFTFQTGSLGTIVDYSKSIQDSELYNKIVVIAESNDSNLPPIYAVAVNTEPTSPTNVYQIGVRSKKITTSLATTAEQCATLAQSYLRTAALEQYEIDLNVLTFPWLDVGGIIRFVDPDPITGQPERFLLSELAMPLALGAGSVSAKRLTVISDHGLPIDGVAAARIPFSSGDLVAA
jgi:hypothetical protein